MVWSAEITYKTTETRTFGFRGRLYFCCDACGERGPTCKMVLGSQSLKGKNAEQLSKVIKCDI